MINNRLPKKILVDGAAVYGVMLDDSMVTAFNKYFELLSLWNSSTNLVSKRDMGRFAEYHLLDSLKVSSCFDFSQVNTMMDFGSGAGFPGIPLALAFPDITPILLDSRAKRCAFLNKVATSIPSLHAQVIHSRIDSFPNYLNETCDVVITRATVSLKDFYRKAFRFIKPGGSLISIKGNNIKQELSDLKKVLNNKLFNIKITKPKQVSNVRQGIIIIITRF